MRFRTIHAKELEDFLKQKDIVIIDLRERKEFAKFHLPNAVNYSMENSDEWEKRLSRNKKLLFCCERGNISMREASKLAKQGFLTFTLVGGINYFRRNQIDSVSGKR